MKLPSSLEAVINAGRRRMRVLWAVATAQRVLPAAAGVGLALAVLARLRPWTWPEPAALAAPLAMLLVVAVGAVAMRIEPLVVARAIDNGSGSRDALATAFEVSESDPFGARVLERARASVPADLGTALPVRIDWRPWAGAAALIVATAALVLVANPQDAVRDRAAAERDAISETADQVDELADRLATNPELAEQADALAALADELRRSDDFEAALASLDEAERQLASSLDSQTLAQRAASDGLAATLALTPIAAGSTAAEQLAAAAAGLEGLTPEQQAELAERLEQLARIEQVGDPATGDNLGAAAEALAAGDLAAASEALESASASADSAAGEAAQGRSVESAAQSLDRLAAELAAQREAQQSGQGSGQGEGSGQGSGQGEGSGEGSGSGSGSGQGQGAGSPSGQVTGGGSGGTGQGGQGNIAGNGTGGRDEPGAHHDATLEVPAAGASDIVGADATATGDGTATDPLRVNGTTTGGVTRVPVSDVVNEFEQRAVDAIDRLDLGPSEARVVEGYFDRLVELTTGNG